MEPFVYSLKENQPKVYRNQRLLFLLLGTVYTLNGAVRVFSEGEDTWMAYVYLITGIALVISGFVNRQQLEDFKIQFNNDGVFSNTGLNMLRARKIDLRWEEIKEYNLAPLRIDLILSDGKKRAIPLDSLGYHDVRLIKETFKRFAIDKISNS